MLVVIDTNVLLRLFGRRVLYRELRDALLHGKLFWAVSTEILLEFEEILVAKVGQETWERLRQLLEFLSLRYGTVCHIEPTYRFQVIDADPNDNKFTDFAITAHADFVITDGKHFAPLATAGHKPKPISPTEFISRFLHKEDD